MHDAAKLSQTINWINQTWAYTILSAIHVNCWNPFRDKAKFWAVGY